MKLVTVATQPVGYFPFLMKSCKRHNAPIDVLGWNQKWQGFAWKFHLMLKYLESLPENEVVCFIDAYDVILLRPLHELENAFKTLCASSDCKVIVGCDKALGVHMKLASSLIFGKCQNKPINTGTYIGYVRDLKALLKAIFDNIDSKPGSDDQILMSQYCRSNPHSIHIDCDSIFFLTILNPYKPVNENDNSIAINNKRLMFNGIRPFFLHGNGNTNMNEVIRQLDYDMTTLQEEKLHKYHKKSFFRRVQQYLPYFIKYIVVLILLIIAFVVIWKVL